MIELINKLHMLNRSLITDDYDKAVEILRQEIPEMKIHKIPTGKECWTWVIPEKWSVSEAYIEDSTGKRILDMKDHVMHVISYSLPINTAVSRAELLEHVCTRKDRPDAIPFGYKYYAHDWGFCMAYNKAMALKDETFHVVIKSEFSKGTMKIIEIDIKGKMKDTIVIAAHLCHPGQANDDLSGVAVCIELAKWLKKQKNKYSYKILIFPETIGSTAYLSQNEKIIPNLKYGIFLEMLGNDNVLALQKSWEGNTRIDRVVEYVRKHYPRYKVGAFRKIISNDEIIFNAPGVGVPMISLSRFPYPEYHTSDDNPSIISNELLLESLWMVQTIIETFEQDYVPKRKFKGIVFFHRYGLKLLDWTKDKDTYDKFEQIMLLMEGNLSVFDIAEKVGLDFEQVLEQVNAFKEKGLVEVI